MNIVVKIIVVLILVILLIVIPHLMRNLDSRFRGNDKERSVTIGGTKIQVEIADSLVSQTKGLSGRDSLCESCGMLFLYESPRTQTFWMKGMKFPLDIIFIKGNQVVDIAENVPIPRSADIPIVTSKVEADMVLEVNAGFVKVIQTKIGDKVKLESSN